MTKLMKKFISCLLISIICAVSFHLPAQAAEVYKDETALETAAADFEDFYGRIAEVFDRIAFLFAS